MPRGDRTGPMGMGPRTGRAVGYCAGSGTPNSVNPGIGRSFWMRMGRCCGVRRQGFNGGGRRWRNMLYATGLPGWMRLGASAVAHPDPSPESALQSIKNQIDALQSELDLIRRRMSDS